MIVLVKKSVIMLLNQQNKVKCMKKLLLTSLVSAFFLMGMGMAHADLNAHQDLDNQTENQVYEDKNFNVTKEKAITLLQQKGYNVVDVEADDYRGKPSLSVEATKNGQEYDIEMLYPSLKIVKEKIDR